MLLFPSQVLLNSDGSRYTTIFFNGCTFHCVFCQNWDISQEWPKGDTKHLHKVDAEQLAAVVNRLYAEHRLLESFTWERLPHAYHGSGCTLAAACAATFAHGFDPLEAIAEAQDYTWHALKHAYRLGMGQLLPDRLYWAREETDGEDDDD